MLEGMDTNILRLLVKERHISQSSPNQKSGIMEAGFLATWMSEEHGGCTLAFVEAYHQPLAL